MPVPPPPEGDADDVTNLKNWAKGEFNPSDLVKMPCIHEQEDGSIFGVCATGTSSKDSLLSWIRYNKIHSCITEHDMKVFFRFMQRDNPALENVPILFVLTSPFGEVIPLSEETDLRR